MHISINTPSKRQKWFLIFGIALVLSNTTEAQTRLAGINLQNVSSEEHYYFSAEKGPLVVRWYASLNQYNVCGSDSTLYSKKPGDILKGPARCSSNNGGSPIRVTAYYMAPLNDSLSFNFRSMTEHRNLVIFDLGNDQKLTVDKNKVALRTTQFSASVSGHF